MASRLSTYLHFIGKDQTGKATKSAVGNLNRVKSAGSAVAGALGPLTAAAAVSGFAAMIKTQIDAADKVQKLSLQLGVSTEALSQYQHVAKITGTSFETMTKGLRYMQKNLADAQDGLTTAQRAFDGLGVSVDRLIKMRPEDAFLLIGDALSHVPDEARRTQIAMNVFGRAGAELIQTFSDGAGAVQDLMQEADELGLTISQDLANNAADANDAITRLSGAFTGLGRSIALETAGPLSSFIDALAEAISLSKEERLQKFARQLAEDQNGVLSFPTPFAGYGEAMRAAANGVAVFGDSFEEATPKVTAAADAIKTIPTAYSFALGQIQDMGAFTPIEVEEILAEVDAVEMLGEEAERAMMILGDSAQVGAARMADAIERAVFEAEDLLEGLGDVARSVFSSILSGFITMGVRSILPASWIGAGVDGVPGADFIGPLKSAGATTAGGKSSTVNIGNLNVSATGTISNDPMSVRQLAVTVYDEIQKVSRQHG